jgi:hypothetical protein
MSVFLHGRPEQQQLILCSSQRLLVRYLSVQVREMLGTFLAITCFNEMPVEGTTLYSADACGQRHFDEQL